MILMNKLSANMKLLLFNCTR